MGVLISRQPPMLDMVAEAVRAGFYEHKTICGMGEGWSRLAAMMQLKDAPLNRRDAIDAEAKPPPNRAKRLECAELAPAFARAAPFESASKLVALQTLRVTVHPGNQSGRRLKLRQRHGGAATTYLHCQSVNSQIRPASASTAAGYTINLGCTPWLHRGATG